MDIKDRIRMIMEREDVTSGVFAESIGIGQSTFSHVLSGRNNPSLDVIMKVHQKYNDISLDWLLYGNGEMIQNSATGSNLQQSLFDENPTNSPTGEVASKNCKETASESSLNSNKETVKQEIRYIEKPHRKITEIRIFFDDNTYETFKGEK